MLLLAVLPSRRAMGRCSVWGEGRGVPGGAATVTADGGSNIVGLPQEDAISSEDDNREQETQGEIKSTRGGAGALHHQNPQGIIRPVSPSTPSVVSFSIHLPAPLTLIQSSKVAKMMLSSRMTR
jgi:hypothetical protein